MCIVCVLWKKGELTPMEARENLSELLYDDKINGDHALEVKELIEGVQEDEKT